MRSKWAVITDLIVSLFCGLFAVSSFFSALIYHNAGQNLIAGADMLFALMWLAAAFKTPLDRLKEKYDKRK